MAVPAAIPRRPTLLFIVVLALLFVLMSLSTRTRYVGETRTMFERSVMTLFAPVPKTVNWVGAVGFRRVPRLSRHAPLGRREPAAAPQGRPAHHREPPPAPVRRRPAPPAQPDGLLRAVHHADHDGRAGHARHLRAASNRSILDRGSNDGIEVNDAVVNANGLIGRVVLTTKDMAKVQLVTDGNSSVGVLVDRTRRQGVLRGDGASGAQLYDIPSLRRRPARRRAS